MQPGTDQWGPPAQPVAQQQYGQPPQPQVMGQPTDRKKFPITNQKLVNDKQK